MIREAFLVCRVDIVLSKVAAAIGSILIGHHKITGVSLDSIEVLLYKQRVESGLVFVRNNSIVLPFIDDYGYFGIIVIHPSQNFLVFFTDDEDEGAERHIILTNPFVASQRSYHAGISRRVRVRCNQHAD